MPRPHPPCSSPSPTLRRIGTPSSTSGTTRSTAPTRWPTARSPRCTASGPWATVTARLRTSRCGRDASRRRARRGPTSALARRRCARRDAPATSRRCGSRSCCSAPRTHAGRAANRCAPSRRSRTTGATSPAAPGAQAWWDATGLDAIDAPTRWLVTSDAAGRGAGYHLAVFAHDYDAAEAAATSGAAGIAAAGMSPLPPYETIFGSTAGDDVDDRPAPEPASAWLMRWEPITSLRA